MNVDKLKDILRSTFVPPEVKDNPIAPYERGFGGTGRALSPPDSPKLKLNALNVAEWAYISINQIGKSLSSVPIIAESRQSKDGALQWLPLESGPLAECLERPNDVEPSCVLWWRVCMSLLTGDGYLVCDDTTDAIYHGYAEKVRPQTNNSGEITGWQLGTETDHVIVDGDQVIHMALPNPSDPVFGLSPLKPIEKHLEISYYYAHYLKNYFRNGAVPGGILESDDQYPGKDIVDENRSEWNALFQGYDQAHKVAFLFNGLKYHQITPPLKDLIVETIYKMPRETVLAAFGVPPVLAGLFEYANYANSKEQIKIFWENTVIPLLKLIEGYLNIQWVPRFGDNLRVRFDTSKIQALQPDEDKRADRIVKLVKGGVWTPNEAREKYGLEPADGGDELVKPGAGLLANASGGEDGKAIVQPSQSSSVKVVADRDPHRSKISEMHYKGVITLEKKYDKIIRRFFDGQLERVLENLNTMTYNRRFNWSQVLTEIIKADDDDASRIFNMEVENAEIVGATGPFIREQTLEYGQRAAHGVSIDAVFRLKEPKVQAMLAEFHNRSKLINNTTYEQIKRVLGEIYDEGLSLDEAARRIEGYYSTNAKVRSARIAKTEMGGVVNGAHLRGGEQAGATTKEWMSAFMADSRDSHKGADGISKMLGEPFILDGDQLQYPGDPNAPVGQVVNCYCSIVMA